MRSNIGVAYTGAAFGATAYTLALLPGGGAPTPVFFLGLTTISSSLESSVFFLFLNEA